MMQAGWPGSLDLVRAAWASTLDLPLACARLGAKWVVRMLTKNGRVRTPQAPAVASPQHGATEAGYTSLAPHHHQCHTRWHILGTQTLDILTAVTLASVPTAPGKRNAA